MIRTTSSRPLLILITGTLILFLVKSRNSKMEVAARDPCPPGSGETKILRFANY